MTTQVQEYKQNACKYVSKNDNFSPIFKLLLLYHSELQEGHSQLQNIQFTKISLLL